MQAQKKYKSNNQQFREQIDLTNKERNNSQTVQFSDIDSLQGNPSSINKFQAQINNSKIPKIQNQRQKSFSLISANFQTSDEINLPKTPIQPNIHKRNINTTFTSAQQSFQRQRSQKSKIQNNDVEILENKEIQSSKINYGLSQKQQLSNISYQNSDRNLIQELITNRQMQQINETSLSKIEQSKLKMLEDQDNFYDDINKQRGDSFLIVSPNQFQILKNTSFRKSTDENPSPVQYRKSNNSINQNSSRKESRMRQKNYIIKLQNAQQNYDNYKRQSQGFNLQKLMFLKNQLLKQIIQLSHSFRLRNLKRQQANFFNDKSMILHKQWPYFQNNNENTEEEIMQNFHQKTFLEKFNEQFFLFLNDFQCKICCWNINLFYPSDKIKIFLDSIYVIFILYGYCIIPIFLTFNQQLSKELDLLLLIIIFCQSVVTLNTALYKKGKLETQRVKIFILYLKQRLFLDLTSFFSIFVMVMQANIGDYKYLTCSLFFLKLNQFLETKKKLIERIITNKNAQHLMSIFELLTFLLIFSHYIACIWVYIAQFEKDQGHSFWLQGLSLRQEESTFGIQEYLIAFYFVIVSMATVGYGDISPTSDLELFVCILTVIILCGMFAFAINKIGLVLNNIENEQNMKRQFLQSIGNYMKKKNISQNLQYSIREYIEFYFQESIEDDIKIEQSIFDILSEPLKKKLLLESYKIALQDSKIFRQNFSENVLQSTIELIKEEKYVPEQIIFLQGDIGSDIFFVQEGQVEIILCQIEEKKLKHINVIKTLERGACFGESEFFTGKTRSLSIRSKDFSTVMRINQKDFLSVLKDNPEDYEIFNNIKDKIILNKSVLDLGSICLSCQSQFHQYKECPYITFQSNKFQIYHRHNFSPFQERFDLKIRKDSEAVRERRQTLKNTKIQELNQEYMQRRGINPNTQGGLVSFIPYIVKQKPVYLSRICGRIIFDNLNFLEKQIWYIQLLQQIENYYEEDFYQNSSEQNESDYDSKSQVYHSNPNNYHNNEDLNFNLPNSQQVPGGTKYLSKVIEESSAYNQYRSNLFRISENQQNQYFETENSVQNAVFNNLQSQNIVQSQNNPNFFNNNGNFNFPQSQTQDLQNISIVINQLKAEKQNNYSQQLQYQEKPGFFDRSQTKSNNNLQISGRTDRSNSKSKKMLQVSNRSDRSKISLDLSPSGKVKGKNTLNKSIIQHKMTDHRQKRQIKYRKQSVKKQGTRNSIFSNNNDFIEYIPKDDRHIYTKQMSMFSHGGTHTFIQPMNRSTYSQNMFGAKRLSSLDIFEDANKLEEKKQLQQLQFDSMKLYRQYFPKNNYNRVLNQLEQIIKQNYQKYNLIFSLSLIENKRSQSQIKISNKFKRVTKEKISLGPSILQLKQQLSLQRASNQQQVNNNKNKINQNIKIMLSRKQQNQVCNNKTE